MTTTDPSRTRTVPFGSLTIAYDDQVLEPRGWTRWQSYWAAELAQSAPAGPILELCTGVGHIGLLAVVESDRDLVAVDLSEAACRYADLNARAAGLIERVEIRNASLETACAPGEVFPLIIADPPWVPAAETSRFPEDPLSAIDGGPDGLDLARACLAVADAHLHEHGAALLQVGSAEQVAALEAELSGSLRVVEVREEPDRGVVALLTR